MVKVVLVDSFSTDNWIQRSTSQVLSVLNQDDFEHTVSRNLHRRFDRLLHDAKLVRYIERKRSSS